TTRGTGPQVLRIREARAGLAAVFALIGCSRSPAPAPASPVPSAPSVAATAPPARGPRLFVTNERSGDLSVIDVGSRSVVTTVKLSKRPRGIRLSPDGALLYI